MTTASLCACLVGPNHPESRTDLARNNSAVGRDNLSTAILHLSDGTIKGPLYGMGNPQPVSTRKLSHQATLLLDDIGCSFDVLHLWGRGRCQDVHCRIL